MKIFRLIFHNLEIQDINGERRMQKADDIYDNIHNLELY